MASTSYNPNAGRLTEPDPTALSNEAQFELIDQTCKLISEIDRLKDELTRATFASYIWFILALAFLGLALYRSIQ